jgi:DNA repair protein RadC
MSQKNNKTERISERKSASLGMRLQFVSDFKGKFPEEKPREKLQQFGAKPLAPWELLALLMRIGKKHKGGYFEDVETLSKRLIAEGGFKGIFSQSDVFETMGNFHIHKSHAEIIVAVSEIVRRMDSGFDIFDARNAEKIYKNFQNLRKAKQEQCHVLHIDHSGKCIHSEMVGMGNTKNVSVTPNLVFRSALWLNAHKIAVVHNHLGEPKPSKEDIIWTTALARNAWEIFQIQLVDHIIIGNDGSKMEYFSFQEKNLL